MSAVIGTAEVTEGPNRIERLEWLAKLETRVEDLADELDARARACMLTYARLNQEGQYMRAASYRVDASGLWEQAERIRSVLVP